jgi:hypothetical protein
MLPPPLPPLREAISGDPIATRRGREVLYEWPELLSVYVLADRSVGQFAGSHAWSRREVEAALAERLFLDGSDIAPAAVSDGGAAEAT